MAETLATNSGHGCNHRFELNPRYMPQREAMWALMHVLFPCREVTTYPNIFVHRQSKWNLQIDDSWPRQGKNTLGVSYLHPLRQIHFSEYLVVFRISISGQWIVMASIQIYSSWNACDKVAFQTKNEMFLKQQGLAGLRVNVSNLIFLQRLSFFSPFCFSTLTWRHSPVLHRPRLHQHPVFPV